MDLNDFIDRWSARRGGAERANYQMFLTELCEALELPRPDPASDDNRSNDYVFERGVKRRESEGVASTTRIDLYKRGCFILEAKQSRASQRDDGGARPSFFKPEDGASPRTLLRRFRGVTGETPLMFRQRLVVEAVRGLLETTTLPLAETPPRVGYADDVSLRRVFRARTGLTLAAYRRRFGALPTHRSGPG